MTVGRVSLLYASHRPTQTLSVIDTASAGVRPFNAVEESPVKVVTHLIPRD